MVSRDNVYSVDLGAYKGGNATEAAYGGFSIQAELSDSRSQIRSGVFDSSHRLPQSGKPNFVGKSIRLYDTSGRERYSFKKTDEIKMRGILANEGTADIPSDKKVKSMFLMSKGYKEDPHGDWQKVGTDETKSENIRVGDSHEEEEGLKLWERSDIQAGRVYNIVFCADRTVADNNNGGDYAEIHESDNCTTEAAFEVEGTYNFTLASFSVGTNQTRPRNGFCLDDRYPKHARPTQ